MSLKSFHIVFIAASVMLCLVLAAWCFLNYRASGASSQLLWAGISAASGLGLVAYGGYFLRKLKNISYL